MKLGFEWKSIVLAVALTPAVVLTGCKTSSDSVGLPLAEPVAILEDASGSSEALSTAATTLITNQADWEAGGFAEACPAPMDFAAHDVVVVAMGEQNPARPNAKPDGTPDEEGRAFNRRVDVSIAVPAELAGPNPDDEVLTFVEQVSDED